MGRKTPEGRFKEELTQDLKDLFPGCFILKNDEQLLGGIPDMLILWEDRWAMLEVKKDAKAVHEPGQDWYIDKFDSMSFGAFIFPENKEEVLDALQRSFQARRAPRISQR